MPLIQAYKVISKTTTGHVDEVEIGVPDWVYNGIVKEEGHPHILTINPDYFLIGQSIGRVIYRLARKAARNIRPSTVSPNCTSVAAPRRPGRSYPRC
jgi:Replication initiator protein A